jgi:hypothetical protein
MVWSGKGKVQAGSIVLTDPVPLPEGTEVEVQIEPLGTADSTAPSLRSEEFAALPFFGMWADREDMKDSVAWVQKERAKWHQRAARQE